MHVCEKLQNARAPTTNLTSASPNPARAGVGIESAKNLILSNVGAVMVWDPAPATIRDLGANFYLNEAAVRAGTPRAEAAITDLKSLNPFCKVDIWTHDVTAEALAAADGTPFSAIIITQLLPKAQLFALNEYARANNIGFTMAITHGVTASLFSVPPPPTPQPPTPTPRAKNIPILLRLLLSDLKYLIP